MLTILLMGAAWADAFVLEATSLPPLTRAVRAAQRLDPERIVALGPLSVCVETDRLEGRDVLRLARKLGRPPEPRDNCDVAHFPLGTGWLAVLIEPPATELEDQIPSLEMAYYDLRRPTSGDQPLRLCLAMNAVPDPKQFAEDLEALGGEEPYQVRAMYEVGGCQRG